MSYHEGFGINPSRRQLVLLQVDPFQVGNTVEGSCWDAADVVPCRLEQFQSNEYHNLVFMVWFF